MDIASASILSINVYFRFVRNEDNISYQWQKNEVATRIVLYVYFFDRHHR